VTERILVIIPTLNEALAIGPVIQSVRQEFPTADVLVIDAYSRDKTVEVSLASGAQVIQVAKAFGIAAAVEAGILHAHRQGYDYLVRVDGDGQHPPAEVKRLLKTVQVDKAADFVIGSRFLGDADYEPNLLRTVSISTICFLLRVLHGARVTDCTSGCVIYNRQMIEFFATDLYFEYSEVRSIWVAQRGGFQILEQFINMAPRQTGVSSFSMKVAFFYMFKNILDLILSTPLAFRKRVRP